MIRDRIIIGIQLLEKIQLDPTLTLDKAIANIHQAEVVNREQPVIRGDRQEEVTCNRVPSPGREPRAPIHYNNTSPQRIKNKLQSTSGVAELLPMRGENVLQGAPPTTDMDTFEISSRHPHMQSFLGEVTGQESSTKWTITFLNGQPTTYSPDRHRRRSIGHLLANSHLYGAAHTHTIFSKASGPEQSSSASEVLPRHPEAR